ncbi:MAG: NAD-dependent epimerase/dehydratase family protein [Candidatus Aminicenantaceae bacterium]
MSERELHVIFGAGPVGLAVMDELLARGKQVRMVTRSGRAEVPDGVEIEAGDAADLEVSERACQGAAVVYSCCSPPYDKWPELFPPLQNGIIVGAVHAGAKLVSMENLYMYGQTRGKPVAEDLNCDALTRKGMIRARMAEELMSAHQSGRIRVVIARASDFFGPRALNAAMGDRVFYPALAGKKVQVLGNPDLLHTMTFVPDIARALVLIAEKDEALGKAWHIPSPETVTTREFIERVFADAGKKPRIQSVPRFMVKIMGAFLPVMRELNEMLYLWEEPFVVDHSKFEVAFGFKATPLDEAITQTVEWFRTHPKA